MKIPQTVFDSLISSTGGPDISFSFYHECLHSIAFTHAKVLSLPRHKFIDPASPINDDGTVSVQFLPHWRKQLLLPLLLCLMRIYIKPQLRLSDEDYMQIATSFEPLDASDISDVLGLSVKHLGRHLHILRSITILEQICNWLPTDPPLDYFLHVGGDPMITLGDILIRDDVQHTVSLLLDHVGSPSSRNNRDSLASRSRTHSRRTTIKSSSHASHSSSIGSRSGTQISIPSILQPVSTPLVAHESLRETPVESSSPVDHPPNSNFNPTPIAHPATTRSARFPNVDISGIRKSTPTTKSPLPRITILHGHRGTPAQSSVPIPNKVTASDPHWDQFQKSRSGFTYAPTSRQHVLRNRAFATTPEYALGATWTHYNIDLNNTHTIVDPTTSSIPPWRAYRPDHDDELLHFPAAVPNVYVDRDLFISSFIRPWENKNQADFLKHFPPLPSKSAAHDLLPFYNKVVPHCRAYYVFVPPLSTLRSGLIMGTWFGDLTAGIQSECLYHFSALLLAALRQKSIGLLGHNFFDFLVTGTDDGYFALYQLAQLGGHPLLNPYPIALHEPTQSVDLDLAAYLTQWIQYLTMQALSGCFLSDRYFIIKFVAGLHPTLRSNIGTDLERHIDHPRYDNRPLPFDFTPAHLWVRLQQRAQFIGYRGQVLAAPRETQRNPNVQQILSSLFPHDDDSSIEVDALLAAISSSGPTCFFCHDASHTAEKCPLLLRTKSDPFAKRTVLRLLQDSTNRDNPRTSNNSRLSTRQIPRAQPRVHALNIVDEEIDPDNNSSEQVPPTDPNTIDDSATLDF